MPELPPPTASFALGRLLAGDPDGPSLVARAAAADPTALDVVLAVAATADPAAASDALVRARASCRSRRDRQRLAVVEAWCRGDRERSVALAREHLAEFPDEPLVGWLTSRP